MATPKSIRLFLAEGDPNGLIVATIPNWSGSVVLGRNADLATLQSRLEANRAGAYILFGDDPGGVFEKQAYIGQTSLLKRRLGEHAETKDWWDVAAIISTSDTNFSTAHFERLEFKLFERAKISASVSLEFGRQPGSNAGRLGEADEAAVDSFLEDLEMVLPTLGIDILRPPPRKVVADIAQVPDANVSPKFSLVNKGVSLAEAMLIDGEFVVLEGARALKEPGHATNQYAKHRQKLILQKKLVEEGEYYRLREDVAFSSPSKAAAVLLDRNANGRTEWKSDGLTFHDWQNSQFVEAEEIVEESV